MSEKTLKLEGSEMRTAKKIEEQIEKGALNPYWIAGFTDGEGSFTMGISLVHRSNAKHFCVRVTPCFTISQKDRRILDKIKAFFGFGTVYKSYSASNKTDYFVYRVFNKHDCNAIVQFFRSYSLQLKQNDFEIWSTAVHIITAENHFRDDEIVRLAELRDRLNTHTKRNRKYQNAQTIRELINKNPHTCIHWRSIDKSFIKQHWAEYSDEKLGQIVNRSGKAVKNLRRKLKLNRRKFEFEQRKGERCQNER